MTYTAATPWRNVVRASVPPVRRTRQEIDTLVLAALLRMVAAEHPAGDGELTATLSAIGTKSSVDRTNIGEVLDRLASADYITIVSRWTRRWPAVLRVNLRNLPADIDAAAQLIAGRTAATSVQVRACPNCDMLVWDSADAASMHNASYSDRINRNVGGYCIECVVSAIAYIVGAPPRARGLLAYRDLQ